MIHRIPGFPSSLLQTLVVGLPGWHVSCFGWYTEVCLRSVKRMFGTERLELDKDATDWLGSCQDSLLTSFCRWYTIYLRMWTLYHAGGSPNVFMFLFFCCEIWAAEADLYTVKQQYYWNNRGGRGTWPTTCDRVTPLTVDKPILFDRWPA